MADEIRRLSDELARDPASRVFIRLGEALRKSGQIDLALRVALRGLERHAHDAEAHDLLARIHVDRGDLQEAFDEWDAVLRLVPSHIGAHKGIGYILFKQGKLAEAERYLALAAEREPDDASIVTALRMVRRMLRFAPEGGHGSGAASAQLAARRRLEEEARCLFAEVLGDGEQTALLLDGNGLITAGSYVTADGHDVAQEMGVALSGVRDEADRVARHLDLGAWRVVTYETEIATVCMAPVRDDSLVLVAAAPTVPLGLVRRVLDACARRATDWLGEEV